MKITITPDGEVLMDTNGSTPAEIAGVVLSVQRELREARALQQAMEEVTAEKRRTDTAKAMSLNDLQGELYDWFVNNDNPAGIHFKAVASVFGCSRGAANTRCVRLQDEGFLRRVGSGKYRAVTE